MKTKDLAEWFSAMPVDDAELIKLEFAVAIDNAIKDMKLTRTQVAQALKTSPAWVTKVLRGDVNLTIESMAKLCEAIGQKLEIKISNKETIALESISVQSVFYMNRYARPKFGGAIEIDLKNSRDMSVYCNEDKYEHAA